MRSFLRVVVALAGLGLFLPALSYAQNEPSPGFNPALYFENAEAGLQKAKGYALVIYQNGKLVLEKYSGTAISAEDLGQEDEVPWTQDRFALIGSVSKPITAIGIMSYLEDHPEIDIDQSISDYLPKRWELGDYFQKVDFYHLMAHRAGLTWSWPNGYQSLREVVENWSPQNRNLDPGQDDAPTDPSCQEAAFGQYCYSNLGYILLQQAFAYLVFPEEMEKFEEEYQNVDLQTYDEAVFRKSARLYENYILDNFFAKAGLSADDVAGCQDDLDPQFLEKEVWLYHDKFDLYGMAPVGGNPCGVGSWVVSPRALVQTFHHLFNSEDILKKSSLNQMIYNPVEHSFGFSVDQNKNGHLMISHRGVMVKSHHADGEESTASPQMGDADASDSENFNTIRTMYMRDDTQNIDVLLMTNSYISGDVSELVLESFQEAERLE